MRQHEEEFDHPNHRVLAYQFTKLGVGLSQNPWHLTKRGWLQAVSAPARFGLIGDDNLFQYHLLQSDEQEPITL